MVSDKTAASLVAILFMALLPKHERTDSSRAHSLEDSRGCPDRATLGRGPFPSSPRDPALLLWMLFVGKGSTGQAAAIAQVPPARGLHERAPDSSGEPPPDEQGPEPVGLLVEQAHPEIRD